MSSSLYEINEQILECIDLDTGEIIDSDRFDGLQLSRNDKLENIALYYKNLLADAESFKNERDSFADREKRARSKAESLKNYLDKSLNGSKFKTVRVDVSYRKSATLEHDDQYEVPAKYLKLVEPTIDKTLVKEDIKAGETIQGFTIIEHNNIQVK